MKEQTDVPITPETNNTAIITNSKPNQFSDKDSLLLPFSLFYHILAG